MDKIIKDVRHNGPDIELLIRCPECQRSILIGAEDVVCPLCMREIEQANIQAWTEYVDMDNQPAKAVAAEKMGHSCRNCGTFHGDQEVCPSCGTDPHH